MTRAAFENAMTLTMVLGGSTNAVLHLLAMAHAVEVDLDIDEFQTTSDRIPFLADLKPSGKYVMEDLHVIGGTPAVLKMLLEQGVLNGDCLTVTGKTMAGNLADVGGLHEGQAIISDWDDPIKDSGHIQILRGGLAPGGSVAKITGKEGLSFTGTALPYDSEEEMLAALERGEIGPGSVIIIRYEGPTGGARYARDAHSDIGHHGSWAWSGRCPDHRWTVLGWLAWFHHRPRDSGSATGRSDRPHRGGRHDRHRHRDPVDQHRRG